MDGETMEEAKKRWAEETRVGLYDIMSCMRDIRKRSERTEAMFDPLQSTVALLSRYNIVLPDSVLKQLEEGPLLWRSLKKKMFQRCGDASRLM